MQIDDYCLLTPEGLVLKDGLKAFQRQNILTDNPRMKQQLDMLDRVGPTSLPLTIVGEKGSGKDNVSRYAHEVSNRKGQTLSHIDCAYLTSEQIGIQLFGVAGSKNEGLLKRTAGGTLYIENADLMPPQMQYRLIEYITSAEGLALNIRYIIGLKQAISDTKELIDPFIFHFGSSIFSIPPLRTRPEDILLLSQQQLLKIKEEYYIERAFSTEVMTAMLSYAWPGNIRQLINTVDRMAFFSDSKLINSVSIFRNSLSEEPQFGMPRPHTAPLPITKSLKEITLEYEVLIINQYIEEYGSLRKAASALKSSPSVLSSKLTKYYSSTAKTKTF